MKLNEELFWWECPTVCQWELWEDSDEFNALDPSCKDFNLHFVEYQQKDPRPHEGKIQLQDIDLTTPPEGMKRSSLFRNYIVPMLPDEFKLFYDKLEAYEQKQEEWKAILEYKRELESGASTITPSELFEDFKMKFDLKSVTVDEFNKLFEEKSSQPRNLFPKAHRQLVEIVTDGDHKQTVEEARDNFRKQQKLLEKEDVELLTARPLKDEPLLLSEFVQEIEGFEESLRPTFRLSESIKPLDNDDDAKPSFRSRFANVRQNRASLLRFSQFTPINARRRRKPKSSRLTNTTTDNATISTKTTNSSVEISEPENVSKTRLIPHYRGKWSTRDIHETTYDPDTKTVTFFTGRTGTFGFATRKYSNLPLKRWEMYPALHDPDDKHVIVQIVTQHVAIDFKVTNDGYTFKLTHPRKVPFQGIDQPIKVHQLKHLLSSLNLNIFPEVDAGWYVENVCKKHTTMELHTYKSMAVYCLSHHFSWSVWNRWAHRRVAIFEARMSGQNASRQIMTTPLKTASVNIRERCTPLEEVELDYELDPPEQDVSCCPRSNQSHIRKHSIFFSPFQFRFDLLSFLEGDVDKKQQHRANQQSLILMWYVQALLINIQPLSFSQ